MVALYFRTEYGLSAELLTINPTGSVGLGAKEQKLTESLESAYRKKEKGA